MLAKTMVPPSVGRFALLTVSCGFSLPSVDDRSRDHDRDRRGGRDGYARSDRDQDRSGSESWRATMIHTIPDTIAKIIFE